MKAAGLVPRSADQSHNVDTANAVRIDGKSKRAQPVKMESHPAWVKRLRMASIWTRSGQETYMEGKRRRFTPRKSHIFPAKTENTRTSRVCVFTLGYAFSLDELIFAEVRRDVHLLSIPC